MRYVQIPKSLQLTSQLNTFRCENRCESGLKFFSVCSDIRYGIDFEVCYWLCYLLKLTHTQHYGLFNLIDHNEMRYKASIISMIQTSQILAIFSKFSVTQ